MLKIIKKLVIKLEILGNVIIEDAYGCLKSNQIFIEGIKQFNKDNIKSLDYNNKSVNENIQQDKSEDKKIKILKNTRKFGKFRLVIPFGKEINLADENPIDEKEEEKEEGIKIIKFKLAKRREKKS